MTQKVTLLLKSENVNFAKNNAKKMGTSMSKIVDDYLDILKRLDNRTKNGKIDPFVKKFGGMISTGKNEDVKSR
jgi:hypothetical protein